MVSRDSKVDNFADFLFFFFFFLLLIIIRSGLLAEIRWSVCILKSYRSLCVSLSRTGAGLCIYHLLVWSNLNFWHNSQWITLPTQSCLTLYSLCASLLHSLIMWLMVSSLSLHSLHLLFCCVLSILAFIWLVLMALFCAAIRRDSVSILKFPFLSHVQVLSYEMLFISHLKRPWSCFPSHFCFLVFVILLSIVLSVLFLMAVISPLSCFSMWSSSRCMDVSTLSSMLASPLPPSFLGTYCLSTSSLGCNALCMVISFLVLLSICLSSSLVHLRKGPEYLTRGTAQVFILWIRFLLESFVSISSLTVFHISFNWWSFTGVWVRASLLKSPGLFSVFCPFSLTQSFGWSPLDL